MKATQGKKTFAHIALVCLLLLGVSLVANKQAYAVEQWGVTYKECQNLDSMYQELANQMVAGKSTIRLAGKVSESDPRECDTFSLNRDMYNNIVISDDIYRDLYDCSTTRFYRDGTMWFAVSLVKENTPAAKAAQTKFNNSEARVKSILKSLNLQGKSEFEKAATIYDWVTKNIKYDWSMKNYTGYTGIMYGKTICNGYANIYRRLCYGAGLECRYLSSQAHAYNIVRVNGKWYYVDTTLEDNLKRPRYDKDPEGWRWFLCGEDNFKYGNYHNTCTYYNLPRYGISKTHYVMPGVKVNPSKITYKKKSGKTATIKWKKVSGVTGYQLGYKALGGTWKTKTYSSKTHKATLKKLKKNKKYSFKIRAYKTVGGKTYYSNWV